jgi:transcriptional regulator with XRE-family HTH domain
MPSLNLISGCHQFSEQPSNGYRQGRSALAQSATESDSDAAGELMGLRIRTLRHQRGLSVNELAARAGVSVGILSQIERGKANPSLKTIERIRSALDVRLSAILESDSEASDGGPSFVRRATQRPRFDVGPYPLKKEHLSPSGARDMQFMIIAFPPGASSHDVILGKGEKAGLVLGGQILLTVADGEATLYEGDSFQFDSELPHKVINTGSSEAKILWIMTHSPAQPHL